jgi:XRE family transcriptional regulator, regulator of sulfur utilization
MPAKYPARLARALGARIRALREEAGITQETLAWDSDLAKGYLSQVEAGKRTPSVQALFALAARLGIEASDMLALDAENPRLRLLEATRRGDSTAARKALQQALRVQKPTADQ